MTQAPLVGLIGGIGAGKSQVAAAFAAHGAKVIAGDPIGHEALRDPAVRDQVAAHFGDGVIAGDGSIDRRALGKIVFDRPEERKALEAIVFPWIGAKIREELMQARRDPAVPLVVLDAAVMLEAGWNEPGMKLLYIHTPKAVRLARVAAQRNWSPADAAIREKAQLSLTDKATHADHALDNAGDKDELERSVVELLELWGLVPRSPHQALRERGQV